jgi:hypothetical protein
LIEFGIEILDKQKSSFVEFQRPSFNSMAQIEFHQFCPEAANTYWELVGSALCEL